MKFTIGIPAYKATFLKECIDSVLSQTFLDFEVVIVNDASPENIDDIVNSYDANCIRYYKNEKNSGAVNVVDNWNKCLSYAQGDFFVLMGDDDKMCPNYLDEFMTLIKKYSLCNVYHCRTIIIDEQSVPVALTEPRPDFESVYDSVLQRLNGKRVFFISDYVFRTEKLKDNGGFYKLPLAWASDDISSYIAAEEYGIAHTNEPVFMYRKSNQTISSTGNVYLKMEAILGEERWLNTFLEKQPLNKNDVIIKKSIQNCFKKSIQKNKIWTIYSSANKSVFYFFKWFFIKKKYGLSASEIFFAWMLSLIEKGKKRYE